MVLRIRMKGYCKIRVRGLRRGVLTLTVEGTGEKGWGED